MSLPQPHDYRFVMLTTMKDEAPYIFDWIAYHLTLGFTHFVIATNDCSDGTDKICRNLEKMGIVTHYNNNEPYPRGIQKTAWKRAERLEPIQKADWLMVLDVDEYLRIDIGNGRLEDLIEAVDDRASAISFVWQVFGNNHVRDLVDIPVIDQFSHSAHPLQSEPYQIRGLKTIFKRACFESIGTHRPLRRVETHEPNRIWLTADGADMSYMNDGGYWCVWNNGLGYGGALGRVHHYAIRSFDAFQLKLHRGFVNRTKKGPRANESPLDYWNLFNWNLFQESKNIATNPDINLTKGKFLGDPKLLRLHNNGFNWHLNKKNTLIAEGFLINELKEILHEINHNQKTGFSSQNENTKPSLFDVNFLFEQAKLGILDHNIIEEYYEPFLSEQN